VPRKSIHDGAVNYNETLYTPRELARKGNISLKTIRRLLARGEIEWYRVGNQIRVSDTQWRAYLDRGKPS